MVTDVQTPVAVPPESLALAQSFGKLTQDVIALKKQGLSGAALIAAIGEAAVTDLIGALENITQEGGELSAEPVGVAEAFALAGFQAARAVTGK